MEFKAIKPLLVLAIPLKTLFRLILLFLQTLIGVESRKEILVQFPKAQGLRNKAIAIAVALIQQIDYKKPLQGILITCAFVHKKYRSV